MKLNEQQVRRIVQAVANKFPTFGGGRDNDANPVTRALKDSSLSFAATVDVEAVVRFVLSQK